MTSVGSLYKLSCFFEIILGLLSICLFFYFRPDDLGGLGIILFFYFSLIISSTIGLKLIVWTQNYYRASDTTIIIGHISNFLKLFAVVILIVFEVLASVNRGQFASLEEENSLPLYVIFLGFFVFNFISIFTFFSYFLIAKKNRKTPSQILEIGKNLNL